MHAGDWLRRGRAERAAATGEAGGEAAAGAAGSAQTHADDGGNLTGTLLGSLLVPGDGWSRAVAESGVLDRAPAGRFESLLASAADPRPAASKSWAAAVKQHAQADKAAPAKLRALLLALATAPPSVLRGADGADARPILVSRENTIAAVNTVAAAAHVLGADAIPHLGEALGRLLEEPWTADSTSVRDACAGALATLRMEEAFEELKAAVPRAQTKAQRELLLLCMGRMPWSGKASKAAGASIAELVVPTHGLDVAGKRELTTHHRNCELTLNEDGSVSSRTLDDAEVVENKAAERVLHAELRAISATYRKELARIEALLATEHSWPLETWRKLYLDHPITRAVASRLVWRLWLTEDGVSPDGESSAEGRAGAPRHRTPWSAGGARARSRVAGFPASRTMDVIPTWNAPDRLRTAHADVPWPEGVAAVQLWHPREAIPGELGEWRAALHEFPFEQPFQQIERDFAAGASDPDKTEFGQQAGEVTDAASWEAALAKLAWTVATKSGPGGKTSDREDLIHREFPEEKVTATAMFARLGSAAGFPPPSATSPSSLASPPADVLPDRIRLGSAWIHRTDDKSLTPLPLAALPARLCSEVERDLHVLMSLPSDAVGGPLIHTRGTRLNGEIAVRSDEASETLR